MYGEFKVQVDKDAPYVIEALKGIYPSNNLEATFASSLFAGLFPIDTFIFGVTKTDVFILASITNRVLTVCLENPKNRSDLSQIKNRIDYYHNEIKDGLRSFGIKVSKSRATISIKSFELSGIWISTYTSITSEFTKNWKSIILAPLIGLVAIFCLFTMGYSLKVRLQIKQLILLLVLYRD